MKKIAILMATYNGDCFLKEQLYSIEKQTYPYWNLYVLDDGSSDETLLILNDFQKSMGHQRVRIGQHNHQGCAKTFFSLLDHSLNEEEFFCYADQDDIWDEDKLERAILSLQNHPSSHPLLYCSSSRLIDANGYFIGHSPICTRAPSFNNALVQNIASGNTMVFNKKSRNLLLSSRSIIFSSPFNFPIHDWWTYLLISAYRGHIIYDPKPSLSYRQHENNLIGCSTSIKGFFKSLHRTWKGKFREWNEAHISFLNPLKEFMDSETLFTLICFEKARQKGIIFRIRHLIKSKVFRQRKIDNLKLYISCLFNKI